MDTFDAIILAEILEKVGSSFKKGKMRERDISIFAKATSPGSLVKEITSLISSCSFVFFKGLEVVFFAIALAADVNHSQMRMQ